MSFKPTDAQLEMAFLHADTCQPMESCGVIAGGDYIPMVNQADVPGTFAIDWRKFMLIGSKQKIEAVVHSHVNLPPLASEADRSGCEATGLPWMIITWPDRRWSVINPIGWRAPLVGREWAWGSQDCWALVRDGLHDYAGLDVPSFLDRDFKFWLRGANPIRDLYAQAGFVEIPLGTQPQHCDVLCMRIDSPILNHVGLYLEDPQLGGVLLHQLMYRLSVREVYGGMYLRSTELHLRHRNLMADAA